MVQELGKAETYIERGIAYQKGDGVPQDYEQAAYWLNAACDLGSDRAEVMLQEMRMLSLGVPYESDARELEANVQADEFSANLPVQEWGATTEGTAGGSARSLSANPNRCIACGMEALVPSTAIAGAKHCSRSKGGCGTTVMIPIVESGLDRGLAMQPYREAIVGHGGNTYSSLGALVHTIKYDARIDDSLKSNMIAEVANRIWECGVIGQLTGGERRDLVIVPAPSSKRRKVQPVHLLAQLISEQGYGFENALTKRSSIESKSRPSGTELAPGDVRCIRDVSGKAILLVDDTYGEGATLRACIRALREKGAREVYFLSLCKNIFGGMKGSAAYDDDIY